MKRRKKRKEKERLEAEIREQEEAKAAAEKAAAEQARKLAAAPDRVLWGTDWPHPNIAGDMPNDGDLVDLLAEVTDDDAMRRKVLVDNPARLYFAA